MSLNPLSKLLIIAGVFLIIGGLVWNFWGEALRIGRLPGDIRVEKENFGFYFPITTSILVSILLSFAFWLYSYFSRH